MEVENGKKQESHAHPLAPKKKLLGFVLMSIRVGVVLATAAAALTMGLNKQTKTLTMAILGTASINQTHVAKFQQNPSFLYFVVANGMASGYNLSVLLLSAVVRCQAFGLLVHAADMVVLALVATGVAAAAAMAELGKNGNFHFRWFPMCDTFRSFCDQGEAALVAGFVGAGLLLMLCLLSNMVLYYSLARKS